MKKQFITLILALITTIVVQGQAKGTRVGYIDMEFILQNIPEYAEAKNQLEQKAQKWKQEIEVKKNEVTKLKESLASEKVLLTKELQEEREEEIKIKELETLDYQQKRFGPNGDLIIQKALLIQPIQDQVFTAVQDIAEAKKYDFVLDKSSDLSIIFAKKNFDISEQVVRTIVRTSKKEQLTKKQLKVQEANDKKEDDKFDVNPALVERQKILDEKKLAREQLLAEKKQAAEDKKKEALENRQKLIDAAAAKKNGTVSGNANPENKTATDLETKKAAQEELKAKRAKEFEERKKALEEKKAKILADREAARIEREQKLKQKK